MEKDKYLREMRKFFLDSEMAVKAEQEIQEHLEDKTAYYIQQGIPKDKAEQRAMEDMGSPEILGRKLNQCHPPGIDFLTLRTVLVSGGITFFFHMNFVENEVYLERMPGPVEKILGLFLLYGFGIFMSIFEIHMGMPEFYSVRTKNEIVALWNSTFICGIGIGIAAQSWEDWLLLTVTGGLLILIIRTIAMKRQWEFTKRYLFREGRLCDDIGYKGKVLFIGENKVKKVYYYQKPGGVLEKGSTVVVDRVEGYRLIIIPENR